MQLLKIALNNFRNFENANFDFNEKLTIIVGENARGKTNLLESIHFAVMGRGFRESKEDELIKLEKSQTAVRARIENGLQPFTYEVHLRKTGEIIEKIFMIEKAKQKLFQYKKETGFVVLFSPEQIQIINGPPDIRREYVNMVISNYDGEYHKKVLNYEHALRKRNKLLQLHNNHPNLKEELVFWNNYLEEQAVFVSKKRKEFVAFLNSHDSIDSKHFKIEYNESVLTAAKLVENFEEEKRYKRTLIGPQKDDFVVFQKTGSTLKNLHHYGSRSEQRLAVFWLKMNEIRKLEEWRGEKPILLLDDIFSELDNKNKKLVLSIIEKYQTVMTTTEKEMVEGIEMEKSLIMM